MAQTPWGETTVADAHVHFFSRNFYSTLAAQKKLDSADALAALLDWQIPPADAFLLGQQWITELDRNRVNRACLISSIPGDEASVADVVRAHPQRFFGYFMIDPTQPDALKRVEAAASNPGLHCMCLFPAMHTYSIADPRIVPLLEIASDSRLAVFVHCGAISVGVRKKLGLPSQFDMRFSNPIDLHPVALHFPQVRFIIPHFGAGMFREALMVADLCSNVWLDTSSSNRWVLYEGINLNSAFSRAVELLGCERLLFGTDSSFFPRGWQASVFKQQATALYEVGLSEDQALQVLYWNVERLHEKRLASFR